MVNVAKYTIHGSYGYKMGLLRSQISTSLRSASLSTTSTDANDTRPSSRTFVSRHNAWRSTIATFVPSHPTTPGVWFWPVKVGYLVTSLLANAQPPNPGIRTFGSSFSRENGHPGCFAHLLISQTREVWKSYRASKIPMTQKVASALNSFQWHLFLLRLKNHCNLNF